MSRYPKRLIEVDLPIKKISAHARREKSIRHGHISTLHIWWARRPLAACRAVLCAALWPDPADENCPQAFREAAAKILADFAEQARRDTKVAELVKDHWSRWVGMGKDREAHGTMIEPSVKDPSRQAVAHSVSFYSDLRYALLDFIADFANWDASTVPPFLNTARALTQAAHEALGGIPGTRPLVADPFAGGGSIPLEALRVGADAFASDLNPVAVLLNKVILEYIPRYGKTEFRTTASRDEGEEIVLHGLAEAIRYWGNWIKQRAEQELAEFYPAASAEETPIAYIWARTIISEAPDDGSGIPVEIPLMRSMWLAKKKKRRFALRWLRDEKGRVQTETVEVTYANGVTQTVRRPRLEIFKPKKTAEVENGTVIRGSATCPVTGHTTPVESVRRQLRERRGGANDARLLVVVTTRSDRQGRFYRLPNSADLDAVCKAARELEQRKQAHDGLLSLIPDEELDIRGIRHTWMMIYGLKNWYDLFTYRQSLILTTLIRQIQQINKLGNEQRQSEFISAVQVCLALTVSRQADYTSSLCSWHVTRETLGHTFTRQAIPMIWDFADVNPFSGSTGNFMGALEWIIRVCEANTNLMSGTSHVEQSSAITHPLPDNAVHAVITDPPYYDAVAYAYLSDFFYVWLRRGLGKLYPDLFSSTHVPKNEEIVVDRPHELSNSEKDIVFYERELTRAFTESCRVLQPTGIGTVVFASKTTASWEAILQAIVDAGWVITGSWPIDTEMETRVAARGQARLASSIHIVCRRRNVSGRKQNLIGDWRDVLQALPQRIHEWLPRLAQEGIVGADAIFACIGPALEIFSRYARVEKASGQEVTLRDYLEQVWAAIAREALITIFEGADASGFEEDARLTAIWFWTLKAAANGNGGNGSASGDKGEPPSQKSPAGYTMEYDAARKLAQGLGADLHRLSRPGGIITIKGNIAVLNSAVSRESHLIGRQLSLFNDTLPDVSTGRKRRRSASATLESTQARQPTLFAEEEEDAPQAPENQPWLPSLRPEPDMRSLMERLLDSGSTVLDRLHQAMLLFGRSQSPLLEPFLRESGAGADTRFWELAQALSALYPSGSDEKRWVDGVLAKKKGMGF